MIKAEVIDKESMREGKELILATREFASDSVQKSWWAVLSTLVLFVGALAATLVEMHIGLRVLSSVLAGLLMVRLFVIYHDHQHQSILHKSFAANVLMNVFGLISLSPSSIWKRSHDYHHKHNSKMRIAHVGSFPILTKEQFASASKLKQIKYKFMRHPLTILFGYFFIFLIGMCVLPFLNHPKRHFDSLCAFLLHLGLAATYTVTFGWDALLLTLILPHFIASALGSYLFYAQHNFPGVKFKDAGDWSYADAALHSSSYIKMNPIMQWFTANIGYHHIHHLNAKIPFYRLPEVMKSIPELQNPEVTSLSPSQIKQCLDLKVWDNDRQEMVSFS